MGKLALAALLLCVTLSSAAFACEGQTGPSIFEDKFEDDSGGWATTPGVTIKPPSMELVLGKQAAILKVQNLTFNATEGDYCMTFVMPSSPGPDNQLGIGLEFLKMDSNNTYQFQISSDSKAALFRLQDGTWSTIYSIDAPNLKMEPNSENVARVLVKNGKITTFLNGKQMKATKAMIPQGHPRFGIYTQSIKDLDKDLTFQVKAFEVTAGE